MTTSSETWLRDRVLCAGLNSGEGRYLSESDLEVLTSQLILATTSNGILPADSLDALARALGTLSAFCAWREGVAFEAVIGATQKAVGEYASAAEHVMRSNPETRPREEVQS